MLMQDCEKVTFYVVIPLYCERLILQFLVAQSLYV